MIWGVASRAGKGFFCRILVRLLVGVLAVGFSWSPPVAAATNSCAYDVPCPKVTGFGIAPPSRQFTAHLSPQLTDTLAQAHDYDAAHLLRVLHFVNATNTPSRAGVLADLDAGLTAQIRRSAGFADDGLAIIVDESLNVPGGPAKVAADLRAAGYNARAVREFAARNTADADILGVADALNGRLLAVDRGRQLAGGFGSRTVRVPDQVRSSSDVIRILKAAGL